jgi:RecA/RadA recombinase
MSIRVVHPYKSKGRMRGIDVAVRIVKNKLGPPFKIANIRLLYNKGFRDLGKKEK